MKKQDPQSEIPLTQHAIAAINAMNHARQVASGATWDLDLADAKFANRQNPNEDYNRHAIRFIGSSCLTKIVDAYQWYNGKIFVELAKSDQTAFEKVGESVNLTSGDLRRIVNGENAIIVAAEKLCLRDAAVRRHLHSVLDLWEEEEMGVLVTIRNCFGHHLGFDFRGEIGEWLKAGRSPWGLKSEVSLESDEIILGRNISLPLGSIGLAQISIFDQTIAKTFGLPTFSPSFQILPRQHRAG